MLKTESNTPNKTNEKLKKGNITNNKTINIFITLVRKAFLKINFFESI
jgi:flagellar biosynthesis protein FlhB